MKLSSLLFLLSLFFVQTAILASCGNHQLSQDKDIINTSVAANEKVYISLDGLHCNSCVENLRSQFKAVSGIRKVSVDYTKKTDNIIIEFDNKITNLEKIKSTIPSEFKILTLRSIKIGS
jgi:copper chaperone CopZ